MKLAIGLIIGLILGVISNHFLEVPHYKSRADVYQARYISNFNDNLNQQIKMFRICNEFEKVVPGIYSRLCR